MYMLQKMETNSTGIVPDFIFLSKTQLLVVSLTPAACSIKEMPGTNIQSPFVCKKLLIGDATENKIAIYCTCSVMECKRL